MVVLLYSSEEKKVCHVETVLVTWVIKLGIKNEFGKDIGADFTIHSNITV